MVLQGHAVAGLILVANLAGFVSPTAATAATNQSVELQSLQDGHVVADSRAKLHRRTDRLTVKVATSELEPDEPVDVFWAIFNDPSACIYGNPVTGSPCGPGDLFVEATLPSLQLAMSTAADADGRLAYRASLAVGDITRCIPELPCSGVIDPLGAEVHSAIFDDSGGLQAAQFIPPSA